MMEKLLRSFFKEIQTFDYVVQRNWEMLPVTYVSNGHDDLDLFTNDDHKKLIQDILRKYPEIKCDVRSFEDLYYPQDIALMLLKSKDWNGIFYKPNALAAFFALFYHNLTHKNDNPYERKLNTMFRELYPPVQCKDRGVGFYT